MLSVMKMLIICLFYCLFVFLYNELMQIYEAWETDKIISVELWRNLSLCLIAVAIISLALLGDFRYVDDTALSQSLWLTQLWKYLAFLFQVDCDGGHLHTGHPRRSGLLSSSLTFHPLDLLFKLPSRPLCQLSLSLHTGHPRRSGLLSPHPTFKLFILPSCPLCQLSLDLLFLFCFFLFIFWLSSLPIKMSIFPQNLLHVDLVDWHPALLGRDHRRDRLRQHRPRLRSLR